MAGGSVYVRGVIEDRVMPGANYGISQIGFAVVWVTREKDGRTDEPEGPAGQTSCYAHTHTGRKTSLSAERYPSGWASIRISSQLCLSFDLSSPVFLRTSVFLYGRPEVLEAGYSAARVARYFLFDRSFLVVCVFFPLLLLFQDCAYARAGQPARSSSGGHRGGSFLGGIILGVENWRGKVKKLEVCISHLRVKLWVPR